MPFHRIAQDSAADAVVERLEGLILDGVLRSGDRLPAERDLAGRLDVSRPVLREALKRLEADGLIVARHGEGTFVADLVAPAFAPPLAALFARDDRAVRDLLEFRRVFEGWTAATAARRASPTDRTHIEGIVAAMEAAHEARDDAREAAFDVELHTAIAEAAHNVVALHVAHALYRLLAEGVATNRPKLYRNAFAREALLDQHRRLAAAVVTGDAEAARAVAETHVEAVAAGLADLEAGDRRERAARDRLETYTTRPTPGAARRLPATSRKNESAA